MDSEWASGIPKYTMPLHLLLMSSALKKTVAGGGLA